MSEQTAHTVEDIGWVHHIWDEVGGEITTGVCLIIVAILGYCGVRYKKSRKSK